MNRTDRCSKNMPQTQQKKHPRCVMKLTKILTQLYRNQTSARFLPQESHTLRTPCHGNNSG